jgi:hypothetical protein
VSPLDGVPAASLEPFNAADCSGLGISCLFAYRWNARRGGGLEQEATVKVRFERVVLVAGMAISAVSLWTAAPLLGLWVGSRVAPSSGISMLAVLAVVATIAACWTLLRALSWMSFTYDRLTDRSATVRRHTPWLRSMRGEREHGQPGAEAHLTPLEYVLVGAVLLAWVAFEMWFFFFSSSPIDQRSGR